MESDPYAEHVSFEKRTHKESLAFETIVWWYAIALLTGILLEVMFGIRR